MIRQMKPDAVFLATGGILTAPDMLGVKNRNVMTTPELHHRVKPYLNVFGPAFLGWVTKYYLPIGKEVIVLGAGLHGCETAEFLVKRGRKVTIVESSDRIGEGVLDFRLGLLMEWFGREGVEIVTGASEMEIGDKGLANSDKDGTRHTLHADTIVPTSPLKPNRALFESLEGTIPEVYLIGDGKRSPRMIVDAVREGYHTALTV